MKKSIFLFVLLLQFAALAAPLSAQTSGGTPLEAKLALENSLEKRLRMVLSEALGTEDIIIIISADMQEQGKKAAFEIMPGIPEKEKMGEMSLSSTLTMVKKLSASIILDKSVSDEDTKLAVKLAAGLLGLPPDRQDLISVEKMNFRKARPMTAADLLAPPNIWSLAWIVVAVLLVSVVAVVFLSPLARTARALLDSFNARNTAAAAESRSERPAEEREKAPAAAAQVQALQQPASADGRKAPFWFLSSANPASLAFIMQSRPVEDLTIVLSYAPGETAAKLAETLYPRSVEALAALPAVKLLGETRVRELETEIQKALDYVVGGEDKALNIINNLDEAVQEKALAAFTKLDPALSRKLNAAVIKLADVTKLEPAHAQALARRLPVRVLAAALKTSAYADIFLSKLTGGMQERFRQELDLTRIMPAAAYKEDRHKVVEALRQLAAEGLISLNGPGAGIPPAFAARPAPAMPASPGPKAPAAAPAPRHVPAPARDLKPAAPIHMEFSHSAPAAAGAPPPAPAGSKPLPPPAPKP